MFSLSALSRLSMENANNAKMKAVSQSPVRTVSDLVRGTKNQNVFLHK